MCQILFWNVKRKDLTSLVCNLAGTTKADVIVLNECTVPIRKTLEALREKVDDDFLVPTSISEERFHCFCKDAKLDLTETHKGFRTSTRKLKLRGRWVLLVLVHGVDIRNHDSETRQSWAQGLASEIRFVKEQKKINDVILLGDFNMNPHDRGMNLAMGLNAMMTRECVAPGHRTFQGEKYEFYYNPMWSLQGDGSEGPAGTVYDTSNQGPYGWNMLDQVIVNHSLVDDFRSIQILTHAGDRPLTDAKGRPDPSTASDHLPILVNLGGNLL